MPEKTGPQVAGFSPTIIVSQGAATELHEQLPATEAKYDEMAKDPTIALATNLAVAIISGGEWSVEADDAVPDEMIDFIQRRIVKALREPFVGLCVEYGIKRGWCGFELTHDYDQTSRLLVPKLKHLLPSLTDIMIDEKTGAFHGYVQENIELLAWECVHVAFRVKGTYWYGEALLENVRKPYDDSEECNKGAQRFDKKVAGSHWIVHFPPGSSMISGAPKANDLIAADIIKALESTGSVAIPATAQEWTDQLNTAGGGGWKIELLNATAQQSAFDVRLQRMDKLKVRGLGFPERAILEGQFGTKAEAGVHGDIGIMFLEHIHRTITQAFSKQVVARIVRMNFGNEWVDAIRVVAAPLVDERLQWFRQIYQSVLGNPGAGADEMAMLDTDALKDKLGLPKLDETAYLGKEDEGEQPPAEDAEVRDIYSELEDEV